MKRNGLFFLGLLFFVFAGIIPSNAKSKDRKRAPDYLSKENGRGIDFDRRIELKYAEMFSVEASGDSYYRITMKNGDSYLVVNKGCAVPSNLPAEMKVIRLPVTNSYVVSTPVMDLLYAIDAQCAAEGKGKVSPSVRFCGTREKDWYISEAVSSMKEKKLLYAGKYSAPDFELLLSEGCSLAVENTMILHKSEVKEKLSELGIPVLVELSTSESHPLGRLEWIKLYGILFGAEKEAAACFDVQAKKAESLMKKAGTGKKVAFFSVTTAGLISVRSPEDYIAKMISLSGSEYIPSAGKNSGGKHGATFNMSVEDFFAGASGADILIYNGTIDGGLESISDLLEKNSVFADFKAVKDKKLFTTDKAFFQRTTNIADFMKDLDSIVSGNGKNLSCMRKLD